MSYQPNPSFPTTLLRWYDRHGRHDLPWSKNRTPYRVWVSEIMLQQTQVATVMDYYQRFMKRFPSVKQLALADENTVLAHWSGLGYYRRARHLHQCAQRIHTAYRGRFPRDLDTLMSLPGIGRSTAGAILALSMDQPTPILDGNVKRVLCRIHGITDDLNQPAVEKQLWALAETLTTTQRAADYTQAIMDFGATLCKPKPDCTLCPMQKNCQALSTDQIHRIPNKVRKVKTQTLSMHLLIIVSDGHVLLFQRPHTGIWAKLWCLPECALDDGSAQQWCQSQLACMPTNMHEGPRLRHVLTHRILNIRSTVIHIPRTAREHLQSPAHVWYNFEKLEGGIPRAVTKLLTKVQFLTEPA